MKRFSAGRTVPRRATRGDAGLFFAIWLARTGRQPPT